MGALGGVDWEGVLLLRLPRSAQLWRFCAVCVMDLRTVLENALCVKRQTIVGEGGEGRGWGKCRQAWMLRPP